MHLRSPTARGLAALALAAALTQAGAAHAEPFALGTGPWQFKGSLYAWFPSIDGNFTLPTGMHGGSFVVDANELLDDLNLSFMGSLEAHNGQWGVFTDYIYLDVDGSRSGTQSFSIGGAGVPANLTGQVNLGLEASVWTLAGQYRVLSQPDWEMDLAAGFRMLSVEPELTWAFVGQVDTLRLPYRTGTVKQSPTNWDLIIGAKGRYHLGMDQGLYVPLYLDIGTGDSKLTWQAAAGIGYDFPWGGLMAMWRYLDYEFDDGEPVGDLSFNGPMVGAQIRW